MAWLTDRISRLRGFPAPLGADQRRPPWPAGELQPNGMLRFIHSRPYSIGAPAYVVNAGQAEYNPIGAGYPGRFNFQTMRPSNQYLSGQVWYTPQQIPTTVQMGALMDPATLAATLRSLPDPGPVERIL